MFFKNSYRLQEFRSHLIRFWEVLPIYHFLTFFLSISTPVKLDKRRFSFVSRGKKVFIRLNHLVRNPHEGADMVLHALAADLSGLFFTEQLFWHCERSMLPAAFQIHFSTISVAARVHVPTASAPVGYTWCPPYRTYFARTVETAFRVLLSKRRIWRISAITSSRDMDAARSRMAGSCMACS